MGRIIAYVELQNPFDPKCKFRFDALVDTGGAYLTLPLAWKERCGTLQSVEEVEVEVASQERVKGEVAGPVRMRIEGFRAIHTEVLFLEMRPEVDKEYEPLLGYIPLEQSQAAVDMLGHRLVHVKHVDAK